MPRAILCWTLIGVFGAAVLPWYTLGDGLFSIGWLGAYPNAETGSALYQIAVAGRAWLLWPMLPLLAILGLGVMRLPAGKSSQILVLLAIAGMTLMLMQGFAIIHNGPSTGNIGALAPAGAKQSGMGYGALVLGTAYLMLLSCGLAALGYCRGDLFVVASIALVVALIALFVFFPVVTILSSALQDNQGQWAPALFAEKFFDGSIWGLGCVTGRVSTCRFA